MHSDKNLTTETIDVEVPTEQEVVSSWDSTAICDIEFAQGKKGNTSINTYLNF